ncbi:MAG TPA: COX15/CtaA family protein [Bryobacteraceae bacterium]|jgi:cytochrome c oxidase assembly protein subunit 15
MEQEVNPSYNPYLHRYALALAVCTLFLVVAGASVTSNQAGLSVPDWPLSYGQVMPQMTGGVFFEHGHRMVATFVGMLTVGLAIWLARKEQRAWMRKLGWAALGAVVVQGGLGGLTVLLLLPPAVSVSHACLAQLFFSTTVAIAVFTSKSWFEESEMVEDYGRPSLRSLSLAAPVLVLAQIALGASFRHGAIGVMAHIVGAMVVALAILILGAFVLHQFPDHPSLRPAAIAMLSITLLQLMLGIAAYWARLNALEKPLAMVIATVIHVATGALTLASTAVLAIQVRRHVRAAVPSESREAVAI